MEKIREARVLAAVGDRYMRVDLNDGRRRLSAEAVVDEIRSVEDGPAQDTQPRRESLGRFEHGVEEGLAYQLLVAVREDLAMDTATGKLCMQASCQLRDLIESGWPGCPGNFPVFGS